MFSNGADLETCTPVGNKLKTVEIVGDKYGVSKNTIARLIRIDILIPQLKKFIDNKQISVRAGVEMSYLSSFEQELIAKIINEYSYHLDEHKAHQLENSQKPINLTELTQLKFLRGDMESQ